jgi:CheY-like chemotaxis protein
MGGGAEGWHPDLRFETEGGIRMTTSIFAPPISETTAGPAKKNRVLLVDTSPTKRDLRAEAMRRLGVDVDCAVDISEARAWWRADLYDLVLIHVENEPEHRDKFCEDIRSAAPPQQLAFLVGKPGYLADLPNTSTVPVVRDCVQAESGEVSAELPVDLPGGVPQRWGIMEASRRISAVRSLFHARSRANRERPTPPRDLEMRDAKRTAPWSQVLPELQKEEMQ